VPVETLKAPYLLLASPDMADPNFRHSVVVMGHHDAGGAVGWIVNRLLDDDAASFLPDELARAIHPKTPLRLGGPVLTPGLLVLHRTRVEGIESTEVAPGLLVCSQPDVLSRVFAEDPSGRAPLALLVFGYSGWGPGQLEREMSEGAWLVLPWEEAFAFPAETGTLWERALFRLGVDPGKVATPPSGVN
jgi:putative transcriptional regulator